MSGRLRGQARVVSRRPVTPASAHRAGQTCHEVPVQGVRGPGIGLRVEAVNETAYRAADRFLDPDHCVPDFIAAVLQCTPSCGALPPSPNTITRSGAALTLCADESLMHLLIAGRPRQAARAAQRCRDRWHARRPRRRCRPP